MTTVEEPLLEHFEHTIERDQRIEPRDWLPDADHARMGEDVA